MKKTNNYIKYAGILYLLIPLLLYSNSTIAIALMIIIGMLLIAYSVLSLEELIKSKTSIIIIAIISTIINPIAAVLLFLTIDEISSVKQINNNSPPLEKAISSESKRIDILLKIGLSMILISGLLFATTSWNIISDLTKILILVFIAVIFIGLSKFSEVKLNIPSTTKVYYILGLSFCLLAWIALGYFGVLSEWFSYVGQGKSLVYFLTFIILSIILYLISNKFSKKVYLYLGHISCLISFFCLLTFFGFSIIITTLLLSLISIIINITPSKNPIHTQIKQINEVLSYIYWPLIVVNIDKSQTIITLVAFMLNIINILYITIKKESTLDKVYAAITSNILIVSCSVNLTIPNNLIHMVLFSALTIFSLIIKNINIQKRKWFVNINQVLYHVISLVTILASFDSNILNTLIITAIYLIYNTICCLNIKSLNNKIDFTYNPVVIFIFICSLSSYINTYLFEIDYIVNITLASIVYAIINLLSKKNNTKNYYLVITIISTIISYLSNQSGNIITTCILTLLSIYIFVTIAKEKRKQKCAAYIFLLLNMYSLCSNILPGVSGNILMILILGLISFVCDSKQYRRTNYFAVIIPMISLIEILQENYAIYTILSHILIVYILFLISKLIIKKDAINDTFLTIFLPITLIDLLSQQDLYIGIYIGILSIFIIYFTYNKENYKKLFYTNIIIMIINIIIQLWEFWAKIPFWLYLLVVGVGIIAFVTYKELNKNDKAQLELKNQSDKLTNEQEYHQEEKYMEVNKTEEDEIEILEEENSEYKLAAFCPECGKKNQNGNFCGQCGSNLLIKK